MEKILWAYKTVAVLPDSSGMYRVRFGRLSDLGAWNKEARDEFEKRESVTCPTKCFEISREDYDAFDDVHPKGYTIDSGDIEGDVQFVREFAPV